MPTDHHDEYCLSGVVGQDALDCAGNGGSSPASETTGSGFDASVLDRLLVDLGPDTVCVVVDMFVTQCLKQFSEMRGQFENRQSSALVRQAHSLASAAATVGMMRLSEAAKEIERGLAGMSDSVIVHRLQDLESCFAAGLDALRARQRAAMRGCTTLSR